MAMANEELSPQAMAVLKQVEPLLGARWRKVVNAREAHAEELQLALNAYENGGHTGERWNRLARQAIDLFAKPPLMRTAGETDQKLLSLCAAAIDAGCTDPYIIYIHTRTEHALPAIEHGETESRYFAAIKDALKAPYPPALKAILAADYLYESEWIWMDELSGALWSNLPEAMETIRSNDRALALAEKAYLAMGRRKRQETFDRIFNAYAAARPENDSGPLTLKGLHYFQHAREDGRQFMRERYEHAANAFTQAWEKDPHNALAAVRMITIVRMIRYSAEESDLWLQRAVAADPDCYDAYLQSLTRWRGKNEEMLKFAHACFATDNWRGLTPFILLDARLILRDHVDDRSAYIGREDVWEDIKRYFEGYLAMFPDSPWHRSRFAFWACECRQWDDAFRLFEEIGEEPELSAFGSRAVYDYLRRKAAGAMTKSCGW